VSQCGVSCRQAFPYLMLKTIFTQNQYLWKCALLSDGIWRHLLETLTSSRVFISEKLIQSKVTSPKPSVFSLVNKNYR
jgi:hypothetical protein